MASESDQSKNGSDPGKAIADMSEAVMADSIGLMMQNAVTTQQGMQTIGNTTVSTACTLIISLGAGNGK